MRPIHFDHVPCDRSKRIRSVCVASLLCCGGAAGCCAAVATEWIKETRYFLISRDFQRFKIPASAAVFFKTKTSWGAEEPAAEIREETRRLLGTRLRFIDNSAEAQYGISVRLEEYMDYATRNPYGWPATGLVMFAICIHPFKETTESRQNLTFYYFEGQPKLTMFRRAAEAWRELVIEQLNRTLQPQTRDRRGAERTRTWERSNSLA
jgi:hypothetical protein